MFLLGSNMISNRRPISTCPPRTESGKPAPRRKQERQTVCVYVANTCQCYRAGRTFLLVPKKPPKPLRDFHVGDRVKVNPHRGRAVEAVVKAVTTTKRVESVCRLNLGKTRRHSFTTGKFAIDISGFSLTLRKLVTSMPIRTIRE